MRWTRQAWTAALAVVVLLVTLGVGSDVGMPTSAAGAPEQAGSFGGGPLNTTTSPPDVLPAGGRWTVTLLTGDVLEVTADADGRVTAQATTTTGSLRTVRMPDGELYVIPTSVTPLLDRVLDRELFNVTGLVRHGYDDEHLDAVPLIVQRQAGVDVESTLSTSAEEADLPSIGAVATDVPKGDAGATGALLDELAASFEPQARAAGGITKVWLDRQVTLLSSPAMPAAPPMPSAPPAPLAPSDRHAPAAQPALDPNLPQVGADRAWVAGYTGEGTTVAVLDTGVDATHPDLAGKVAAEANFGAAEDAVDHLGHGTHVAALAAGSGAGAPGARSGVAPAAQIISGKVLDDGGWGFESEAIAGMEWAAPQADVVNMSLGYGAGSDGSDPMSQAVDALTEQHDTLFVIAAGNSGPTSGSVDFPGAADRALTVGAVDTSDALAEFSSRGPLAGSNELKPEIVAPGVDVVAARAAGTSLGDPVDDLYTILSGTSMATPHVVGAAAVLAQQHPDWGADELKNSLIASADPIDGNTYDVGAGRLDVGDGVDVDVRPERDVIDPSLPHPHTDLHTETVTWTNTGDAAQTLDLTADLEDREGNPVDAVTIEPATLTLAPGQTGTATLTVDGAALDDGLHGGTLVADPAGGPEQDDLRTPIGVHAAPETTDLTIEATAPAGAGGLPSSFAIVVNLDDFGTFYTSLFFEDTTTVAVPVGRYAVIGDVFSQDADADAAAQVGDPEVDVHEPTTVTFDGASAVPLHPTVTGVETAPPMDATSILVVTPDAGTGGYGIGFGSYSFDPMPPLGLMPMTGDPGQFASAQVFRLQAAPLVVETGGQTVDALLASVRDLPAGEQTYTAVDAGDGADLTGAAGKLAVVRLPADFAERAAVTQRALDAGVALLAFVDEERGHLTLNPVYPERWADVPVITAGGASATTLLAAGAAGDEVTTTVAASPYVYDVVTAYTNETDPEPVISRAEQRQMARIDQRFHRDPDGTGAEGEHRYPISEVLVSGNTAGPLPERRTDYVTAGVTWQSIVDGHGFIRLGEEMLETDDLALGMDAGVVYEPGSRTRLDWLRRPQWPGPVGGPQGASGCQPTPVRRIGDNLQVWLAPFQDERDRFGCADPHTSTLTLERDGTVVGTTDQYYGEFALPADAGTYRLSYEQTGVGPYAHRSESAWTFRSAGAGSAEALVPLLVVDYDLPLDTQNNPTGRTATFTVGHVTGTDGGAITSLDVWTSADGGATWQEARVRDRGDGEFRVRLPRAADGTPVSLRVDAQDADGNRIEQTLHDAYTT